MKNCVFTISIYVAVFKVNKSLFVFDHHSECVLQYFELSKNVPLCNICPHESNPTLLTFDYTMGYVVTKRVRLPPASTLLVTI